MTMVGAYIDGEWKEMPFDDYERYQAEKFVRRHTLRPPVGWRNRPIYRSTVPRWMDCLPMSVMWVAIGAAIAQYLINLVVLP